MLFDTWGGVLADGDYQRFSLASMRRVFDALPHETPTASGSAAVPRIVFTKGGGLWLEEIAGCGADAVGLDWTVNLAQARARIGGRVALQGNLDPMVLMADEAQVRAQALRVLEQFGPASPGSGHVFNLGHGISQFTTPENVSVLVDTVHEYSRRQRLGG